MVARLPGTKRLAFAMALAALICTMPGGGVWAVGRGARAENGVADKPAVERWSPREKMLAFNGVALAGLAAYGVAFWDYGDRTAHATSEGWFGRGTDSGGADKVGHFYSSYIAGRGFAALARYWGYDEHGAARVGALSSFVFTLGMEVGDSFSQDYGFSHEDFIANTVGSLMAYLLVDNPRLDDLLDIRIEYFPRQSPKNDLVTDYENMKYLLALKFSGFKALKRGPLRYVELVGGYYTRNFDKKDHNTPRRNLFIGVGLNLSEVFGNWGTVAKTFNYVQVPYTYVSAKHTF
jgi:hypothetical protein